MAGDIAVTLVATLQKKSQWVAQSHAGRIEGGIVKEPREFFQRVAQGFFDSFFYNVSPMSPLGKVWTNCLKNHNVISIYPPVNWPLSPSVCDMYVSVARLDACLCHYMWHVMMISHPSDDQVAWSCWIAMMVTLCRLYIYYVTHVTIW